MFYYEADFAFYFSCQVPHNRDKYFTKWYSYFNAPLFLRDIYAIINFGGLKLEETSREICCA